MILFYAYNDIIFQANHNLRVFYINGRFPDMLLIAEHKTNATVVLRKTCGFIPSNSRINPSLRKWKNYKYYSQKGKSCLLPL